MAIRLLSNENIDGTGGFTGDVTIGGKTYPKLNLTDNQGVARNFSVGTNNETFTVRNETGSSDAFTISNANIATFSGHVMGLKPIVDQAGAKDLVLLDELAVGTDPHTGSAIARALRGAGRRLP